MSYLETTHKVYKEAALTPEVGLCCTTNPIWELPGLKIPKIMQEMNYGCGSTVHARDLTKNPKMLYVGVGGGMELLQFSYFNRQKGGVIGIDVVDEMLEASRNNFKVAEKLNPWFKSEFVDLKKGDAMNLPVEDNSIDVAAQNCLFNIFKAEDQARDHGRRDLHDLSGAHVEPQSVLHGRISAHGNPEDSHRHEPARHDRHRDCLQPEAPDRG
jgi:SAM-dependent methyltransferase